MSEQQETVDPFLWKQRHALLYEIQLSRLYHRKRERMFEILDKGGKAIAVLAGSAAFANLLAANSLAGSVLLWVAGIVTITSTLSLVFSFSERSRKHAELAKSFGEVGAMIAEAGARDFTESDVNVWDSKIRLLEANEPAALGALVRICQNEIAVAQGELKYVVKVSWYERLLAHVWDFPSTPRPSQTQA